jgi:hypothetical protein
VHTRRGRRRWFRSCSRSRSSRVPYRGVGRRNAAWCCAHMKGEGG